MLHWHIAPFSIIVACTHVSDHRESLVSLSQLSDLSETAYILFNILLSRVDCAIGCCNVVLISVIHIHNYHMDDCRYHLLIYTVVLYWLTVLVNEMSWSFRHQMLRCGFGYNFILYSLSSILCIGISYLEWKRNNNNNTNILFCYMCRGSTKYTTCVQKGYMMHHYLKERLVTISSLNN